MVMPMAVMRYGGTTTGETMTGVEQVITAPDGRMIPMTGPAGYGRVHKAGRP